MKMSQQVSDTMAPTWMHALNEALMQNKMTFFVFATDLVKLLLLVTWMDFFHFVRVEVPVLMFMCEQDILWDV